MNQPLHVMYLFPGQGSQYVGMGSDLYREHAVVRDVYERASDTLGFDVAALSFRGPQDRLDTTEYTQVALLTHSIACLEALRSLSEGRWSAGICAGHSLGEYSALVAAEALSFEDALRLVRERGRLMSIYGRGKMAAFKLDLESIKPIADNFYCGIGGCNMPDQTVVCGHQEDLDALMGHIVETFGRAKAGRYLNTNGAFHTYLMTEAAEHYRAVLDSAVFKPPRIKTLANYTGDYHRDNPATVKAWLFFQLFHPVKWLAGMRRAIADGANLIVELGGGIGKDNQGEPSPMSRKPNLEGITRKSQRSFGNDGLYMAVINSDSLRNTLGRLAVLETIGQATPDDAWQSRRAVDGRWFRLYVPTRDGVPTEAALDIAARLHETGLEHIVPTIPESPDENLNNLRQFLDPDISAPEPYLEIIVGGGFVTVLHYRGNQIAEELTQIRGRLTA